MPLSFGSLFSFWFNADSRKSAHKGTTVPVFGLECIVIGPFYDADCCPLRAYSQIHVEPSLSIKDEPIGPNS
jgi:hypothetical protein